MMTPRRKATPKRRVAPKRNHFAYWALTCGVALAASLAGCGNDDDDGTEADQRLVGAQCSDDDDCRLDEEEGSVTKRCLLQFKGGYCSILGCETNAECPRGSACVDHEGNTYCFRDCDNKDECNRWRDEDNESNCSSNVTYLDDDSGKACVPPSD